MCMENINRIETVLNNLSKKYEPTGTSILGELSKEDLISKVITAEASLEILKEVMQVLEWENSVWNSSADSKIPRF
jgi:hypothetical protein